MRICATTFHIYCRPFLPVSAMRILPFVRRLRKTPSFTRPCGTLPCFRLSYDLWYHISTWRSIPAILLLRLWLEYRLDHFKLCPRQNLKPVSRTRSSLVQRAGLLSITMFFNAQLLFRKRSRYHFYQLSQLVPGRFFCLNFNDPLLQ